MGRRYRRKLNNDCEGRQALWRRRHRACFSVSPEMLISYEKKLRQTFGLLDSALAGKETYHCSDCDRRESLVRETLKNFQVLFFKKGKLKCLPIAVWGKLRQSVTALEKERDINSFFHVIITVYVIIKVERNDSGTAAFRGMRFRNQTLIYRIF